MQIPQNTNSEKKLKMDYYIDSCRSKVTLEDKREYDESWRILVHKNRVHIPKEDEEEFNECPHKYVVGYFRSTFRKFFCASIQIEQHNSDYRSSGELFRDNFPFFFTRYPNIDSFIDLGCGSGWPVAVASMLGYKSIGVEKSLEVLTLGREVFNELQIEEERLIEGDYLNDYFWENIHCNVNPKDPAIILLFQPKKCMGEGLRVTSKYMHRESRIVVGGDYFSSTKPSVMNDELYQFDLQVETNLFGRNLILKKFDF